MRTALVEEQKNNFFLTKWQKTLSVTAVLVSLCFVFCIRASTHTLTQIHNQHQDSLSWNFPTSHTLILTCTDSHTQTHGPYSCVSSVRHLRKSSFRASGLIWFRMPPRRLEVASEATIRGRTTVGGICRRTPPTAPGRPFCSWPRDATSHRVWAVSITPCGEKKSPGQDE